MSLRHGSARPHLRCQRSNLSRGLVRTRTRHQVPDDPRMRHPQQSHALLKSLTLLEIHRSLISHLITLDNCQKANKQHDENGEEKQGANRELHKMLICLRQQWKMATYLFTMTQ